MDTSDSHRAGNSWADLFKKLFSGRRRRPLSEKELQEIIEESEQEGIINEGEGEMLHSIFEFGETIVREVMVPRTDMVVCPSNARFQHLLDAILNSGHSRIPVYEGTTDRIVGVIYAKDLLRFWGTNGDQIDLSQVMRTPYFVPETKNIEDLLKEFRTKRVHMAIVIDEYGGTSGLITIEDLIEEIVGDIQDEYDVEEEWLVREDDETVLVDGRLNLEELEEYFDLAIPRDMYDTVGGYVANLLGHVPHAGESVQEGRLRLTVTDSDPRKVRKVRVQRLTAAETGEGDE